MVRRGQVPDRGCRGQSRGASQGQGQVPVGFQVVARGQVLGAQTTVIANFDWLPTAPWPLIWNPAGTCPLPLLSYFCNARPKNILIPIPIASSLKSKQG